MYHLGFECYGDGGSLIDCGVILHCYNKRNAGFQKRVACRPPPFLLFLWLLLLFRRGRFRFIRDDDLLSGFHVQHNGSSPGSFFFFCSGPGFFGALIFSFLSSSLFSAVICFVMAVAFTRSWIRSASWSASRSSSLAKLERVLFRKN